MDTWFQPARTLLSAMFFWAVCGLSCILFVSEAGAVPDALVILFPIGDGVKGINIERNGKNIGGNWFTRIRKIERNGIRDRSYFRVRRNDIIKTNGSTEAILLIGDDRKLHVSRNTAIKILSIPDRFREIKGNFVLTTLGKNSGDTIIETASDRAVVKGSKVQFSVKPKFQKLDIKVVKGRVEVSSKYGNFASFTLSAYDSYVGGKTYRKTDSMKYRGLGEEKFPLKGSEYLARAESRYDRHVGEIRGPYSGSVFPRVSTAYSPSPEIQEVLNWTNSLDQRMDSARLVASSFEYRYTAASNASPPLYPIASSAEDRAYDLSAEYYDDADADGVPPSYPKESGIVSKSSDYGAAPSRLKYKSKHFPFFSLNSFGFTVPVSYLYDNANIGKTYAGKISDPYLARKCYGFHMRNRGNNLGDQVAVVYLGNGRVEVRNLVSGGAALLDVRDTDGR